MPRRPSGIRGESRAKGFAAASYADPTSDRLVRELTAAHGTELVEADRDRERSVAVGGGPGTLLVLVDGTFCTNDIDEQPRPFISLSRKAHALAGCQRAGLCAISAKRA